MLKDVGVILFLPKINFFTSHCFIDKFPVKKTIRCMDSRDFSIRHTMIDKMDMSIRSIYKYKPLESLRFYFTTELTLIPFPLSKYSTLFILLLVKLYSEPITFYYFFTSLLKSNIRNVRRTPKESPFPLKWFLYDNTRNYNLLIILGYPTNIHLK